MRQLITTSLRGEGAYGLPVIASVYSAIFLALVLTMLATVDGFYEDHKRVFIGLEIFLGVFFLIEYVLRLWSAPNRLKYAFSFWGIIDLLASLPALALFGANIGSLKTLRLLRLAQLFKILRVGSAHEKLLDAFHTVRKELFVFLILAIMVMIFGSMGIYYFEHDAQPDNFSSIPTSIWWAIATLTTVGYGDVYPITTGGRIFTGFLLLVGLAIVAVPTGLFSSALIASKREEDE